MHFEIGKSEHSPVRQRGARRRLEHPQAIGGPHLNDKVGMLAYTGRVDGGTVSVDGQGRTQGHRHLLHVVIEDVIGFGTGREVGNRGLRHRRHRDGDEQPTKQSGTQRVRCQTVHAQTLGTM